METSAALPDQANRHYLKALTDLSNQHEIEATEDIYAKNGTKLVARGTRVSPGMYERVVQHKLSTPIERSVAMRDTPDGDLYRRTGEQLLEEVPLVRTLCAWSNGRITPLGMLSQLKFGPNTSTLLAVGQQRHANALRHDVMVAMLAMGLSNAYRYNDQKLLADVAVAGIFHDLGEAYVDPLLLQTGRRWSMREWMAYSAHPIISAALAREIGGLESSVQRIVLEHHEQADGHGYPRHLHTQSISVGGHLLALADTLADFAEQSTPNRRIGIALKLMPEEFPAEIVSVILAILGLAEHFSPQDDDPSSDLGAEVHSVFQRMALVMQAHHDLEQNFGALSLTARHLVEEIAQRLTRIQQAFASTGVAGLQDLSAYLEPEELREMRFEAHCVFDEIGRRLRRLSRELALKATHLEPHERELMQRFADAMQSSAAAQD